MSASGILNPNDPQFEPFLYAFVGDDRTGAAVTVLSALARLNLDPWIEAAELASLGQAAAEARLAAALSRLRDVPRLGSDAAAVARDLTPLLPARTARRAPADLPGDLPGAVSAGRKVAPILWVALVLLVLAIRTLVGSTVGPEE